MGPRSFKLFKTAKSGGKLTNIVLKSIGVFSDSTSDYELGDLFEASPRLKYLIMNNNFLVNLPKFSRTKSDADLVNHTKYPADTFIFDDNQLINLSSAKTLEMCTLMPELRTFSARRNMLVDVTRLCL